jgi:Flp pilus assembly pilin Flp
MRRRVRRFRGDEGASAVEFALVLPILIVLLFGVIDYGWWFGETLGLRSGVREAARLGAVNEIVPASSSAEAVKAVMLQRSPQLEGDAANLEVAVRVYGPGATGEIPGIGSTLLVCARMPGESLSGLGDALYPFPDTHAASATMRLEKTPVLTNSQTANWAGDCSLAPVAEAAP